MSIRLGDLLPAVAFPLYGIRPARWEGAAFVGDVVRAHGGAVRGVTFVYLDAIDADTMGAAVSNLGAAHLAPGADTTDEHLTAFVSRFDPDYVVARAKPRRFHPFPAEDFTERPTTIAVGGVTVGAVLRQHRTLPLQLLRVAMRRGDAIADVGIAGWRLSAADLAARVEPVDATFARELDARTEP